MLRLILGLAIAFSLLLLGVGAIVFLYDRFGDLPVWDTPLWKAWKVPIIAAAVVLGVGALLYLSYLSQQKDQQAQQELARLQGWGYCARGEDPDGLIPKIEAILKTLARDSDYQVLGSVMTVPLDTGKLFLFHCSYKSGRNRSFGSMCLLPSELLSALQAAVEICPRDETIGFLTSDKINMGDTAFGRAFVVTAQNPADAQAVVTEPLQQMLLEYQHAPDLVGAYEITLGPGAAFILRWSQVLPEEWPGLAAMGRRVAAVLR